MHKLSTRKGIVANESFGQIKKDENMEARQIKANSCNLIIHSLRERMEDGVQSLIKYVDRIMKINGVKIIKTQRIGSKKEIDGYHRPIKITLENEEIKSKVLKNLIKIKNIDVDILNIQITEDLTIKEVEGHPSLMYSLCFITIIYKKQMQVKQPLPPLYSQNKTSYLSRTFR